MAKISNFSKGAYAKGSNVVASRTVVIPTSVVNVPQTKYNQRGKSKRKK